MRHFGSTIRWLCRSRDSTRIVGGRCCQCDEPVLRPARGTLFGGPGPSALAVGGAPVSRRKPRVHARSKRAPKPRAIAVQQDLDELWAARRSGAHNIAGVRYQIVVGLHLLIEGYARTLPIVAVIPEGLEDLDCEVDGGEDLLIQAKERSDPVGFSVVADFIEHAGGPASVGGRMSCLQADGSLGQASFAQRRRAHDGEASTKPYERASGLFGSAHSEQPDHRCRVQACARLWPH
jgi:hypothetical protein